ncbi:hypothetical protein ACVWYN_000940 [Pedobacter sp. UYP24]
MAKERGCGGIGSIEVRGYVRISFNSFLRFLYDYSINKPNNLSSINKIGTKR